MHSVQMMFFCGQTNCLLLALMMSCLPPQSDSVWLIGSSDKACSFKVQMNIWSFSIVGNPSHISLGKS